MHYRKKSDLYEIFLGWFTFVHDLSLDNASNIIIAILIYVVNSILIFQWAEATKPHPVDNVDITLSDWLNMWGKLCRGAAGISGFPIWVKLLCQLFFDTIDRDHDGVLSEQEIRNFYDVLIEVPQDELDKVTKEGYRAMTAVSIYLNLFPNLIIV